MERGQTHPGPDKSVVEIARHGVIVVHKKGGPDDNRSLAAAFRLKHLSLRNRIVISSREPAGHIGTKASDITQDARPFRAGRCCSQAAGGKLSPPLRFSALHRRGGARVRP